MKIAICDDNPAELQRIRTIVQEFVRQKQSACPMSVHTFASGSDLFLFTKKHGAFDLIILDIIMPDLNGLELAAKLRAHNDDCMIIFL
ncbi:MAG: response regulator, partial [Bacillota bacterium]